MKFWESSAIVPLLVMQAKTRLLQRLLRADPEIVVWWATETECASAIARLERDGALDGAAVTNAFRRLDGLRAGWHEVQPSDALRDTARRLLRVHNLRAADSLQLAAALRISESRPDSLELATLDERLVLAALREGLSVVPLQ